MIRAVEGPLANIHENAPEDLHYGGPATKLRDVWVAVRAGLRSVLENVTLADIAEGQPAVAHRRDPRRPRGLDQALTPAPVCGGAQEADAGSGSGSSAASIRRCLLGTKPVHKGN